MIVGWESFLEVFGVSGKGCSIDQRWGWVWRKGGGEGGRMGGVMSEMDESEVVRRR